MARGRKDKGGSVSERIRKSGLASEYRERHGGEGKSERAAVVVAGAVALGLWVGRSVAAALRWWLCWWWLLWHLLVSHTFHCNPIGNEFSQSGAWRLPANILPRLLPACRQQ